MTLALMPHPPPLDRINPNDTVTTALTFFYDSYFNTMEVHVSGIIWHAFSV